MFLLREIFPNAHQWRFENEQDKYDIYIFILQYLFDVLQLSNEQVKDDKARSTLRNICIYSLLNLENGITLLRFVGIGNPALQSFMENESNWMLAADSNLNHLVQLSMTILMHILRLKTNVTDQNAELLSPLEQLIYTQPKQKDTLRIIPVVTNYMSNVFNRRLPLLSCTLLRRFAIEFQRSLSACLNMEPDQIRLTFLQRLRDDLESNDLKIAILEFVDSCIEKQPGLTEAFFKVSYEQDNRFQMLKPKKTTKSIGDGILTYMEEYLEAVATDPSKINSPQLSRILALFHSLWKNNMQSLVKELQDKPTFWPSLCNPLLSANVDETSQSKAHSQLFNILGIELFKLNDSDTKTINDQLKEVIEKFLLKETFKGIFTLPTRGGDVAVETTEWLNRLQSFKDFIVLVIKRKEFVKIPEKSMKRLIDQCMETMVKRSASTDEK